MCGNLCDKGFAVMGEAATKKRIAYIVFVTEENVGLNKTFERKAKASTATLFVITAVSILQFGCP